MSLFETEQGLKALLEAEKASINERRGEAGNMHECYARIADARDCAVASTDGQKKTVDSIWAACKEHNAEEYDAFASHLKGLALMAASTWLTVAAEADRALERKYD